MANARQLVSRSGGREKYGDITLKPRAYASDPCPPVCGNDHFQVDDHHICDYGIGAGQPGQRMEGDKVQVIVQDDQSMPIPFANVAELDPDGSIIGQGAATNSQGIALVNPGWVQVSHVGYKTETLEALGNATGVTLQEETYNLPTLTIRPEDPMDKKILMAGIFLAVVGAIVFASQSRVV